MGKTKINRFGMKNLQNKRAYSLVQIFVVIVIILSLMGVSAKFIYDANIKKKEAEIQTNISNLQSHGKSFYTAEGKYPARDGSNLYEDFSEGSAQNIVGERIITDVLGWGEPMPTTEPDRSNALRELGDRFPLLDYETLKGKGYLTEDIENGDYYFMDTLTGKVYYIDPDISKSELDELIQKIKDDSGMFSEFEFIGDLGDELTNTYQIERIISSASNGNKFIISGNKQGTDVGVLLVVNISRNSDGTVNHSIEDKTFVLDGGKPVTEIRVLGSNNAVVTFEGTDGKVKYLQIQH